MTVNRQPGLHVETLLVLASYGRNGGGLDGGDVSFAKLSSCFIPCLCYQPQCEEQYQVLFASFVIACLYIKCYLCLKPYRRGCGKVQQLIMTIVILFSKRCSHKQTQGNKALIPAC